MHCFYIKKEQIKTDTITITGSDVNHIKNALRKASGDSITLCDGQGIFYHCQIAEINQGEIVTDILSKEVSAQELPVRIYLFQGIPKKDKMEWIIQKAVELGVYEIIPVEMKFCVAKIEDEKKEKKKLERWQAISEVAAKQSGRGTIPLIHPVESIRGAFDYAKKLGYNLIPYERSGGMRQSKQRLDMALDHKSIGVWIGPEGGFAPEEIALATEQEIWPISLGKRILRTETAGLAVLSLLMFELEVRMEEP